jgi:pimeloyl-ACP methyl ester carboxylesterase
MFARSHDGSDIYYEVTSDADTALVFVHGWMGNVRWWDAQRVTGEFLGVTGDTAATLIEPLYRYDIRAACRQVRVPVRGIGSDRQAANVEANRKYLADYANVELSGCGHYPMLEVPDAFNAALRAQLSELAG